MADEMAELLAREFNGLSPDLVAASCEEALNEYALGDAGGLSRGPGTSVPAKKIILYAKRELHSVLCKNEKKYAEQRKAIGALETSIVAFLTALVTNHFGIVAGVASPLVIAVVTLPAKIGLNAWCTSFRDSQLARDEQIVLREAARKPRA